ncbi:trans-1,2-dihydrobenzene-1,2-diol dehydrogenase-like [Anoplophora glabripennis]|uniref:trans-1,2-dihydrobenzene-1,2-diol dehydrogenase-like n=1 Tax=Anoplophora glabripennis TaxID=217634 RepID=UPI000875992F|nr:trans-1,2-dihydrobenzene-1,2-diol dehydrogenase-like [Anoplophora glabripennis]
MILKWGIVGAGRISHDFVASLTVFPISDHQVVAVAGGSKDRADKFAADHGIPKSYEGYEGLAKDEDVDIVYVGNLNTQHFDTTKLMLEHGKHVLCEKPFTLNEKQTRRLVQIARERKLFLMEAIWSRCFPAYKEMKRLIDSGAIGDVLFASLHFGLALQHVDRLTELNMGGGAILDLGVYILQFQQYIFRGLTPVKIAVNGHLNKSGTDESCGAIITYPGGKMAMVSTSARVSLPNEGIVVGTKGTLRLPDFWCPDRLITPDGVLEFPFPKTTQSFLHKNSVGLSYEGEEARQCIKAGKLESPCITHEESIELARLMDYLRKEMGVAYPEDFQDI